MIIVVFMLLFSSLYSACYFETVILGTRIPEPLYSLPIQVGSIAQFVNIPIVFYLLFLSENFKND